MKVVGGRVYVAPNGVTEVRIFPHGGIEPVGNIDEKTGALIEEMSAQAAAMLPETATPFEVFELMGWKPKSAGRGGE